MANVSYSVVLRRVTEDLIILTIYILIV
jgi:hypothetical protein